ncbi:hypothetical protein Tco_1146444 [Tanacetum coccineum]
MPRSTRENNDNQEVDTNVFDQVPVQTRVQTMVQTATEDNQDTHATSTPLEDLSQELPRNNTTDASVQTSLASSGSGSNTMMYPIGDSSTDLANLLGGIAKCEARTPLNFVSWKSMPDTNLDLMWRDVQHKIYVPEDYKDTCLKLIGGHWKKWKSIVKHDFFTPNKDDSEKLLTHPSNSQAQSLKNSNNQKNLEFLPRTGRTSHANIREEVEMDFKWKSTRIILGWNDDLVDVMIMAQTNQVMHVQANIRADNKALFYSIIYADNYYVAQRALWNNFVGHASLMRDKPWVILGDFNAALNLEDHSCGGYQPDIAMREFKEFVQRIKVMDVNATGLPFTWNQKPKGSKGILKKIDRIMCNHPFLDNFLGSFAIFQPYRIFDHSPCVLRIPKGLKTPLRKLLHDQGNLHDRVNRLHVELDEAQKAIDHNPSCSLLRDEHAHYLLSFKEASLDKERFLRHKSKIEWLNAGDANTAYFHRIVKSKCARNRIEMVRDSSNVLHEGNAVPSDFVSHYEQFLGLEGASTPLDDQGLFTRVLAKIYALFSMGDDKALGPDGFTIAFFKKSWDIMGSEITNAVRGFFSNGKLLKELNHTIISLISKVSTPAKITDYRPISYCNVLFKCISKIIANRIKEDLGDLVSINQSTFVPGRQISDNILLTQELMRNYHHKRGPPRCAFKVNIQKPYDTVDWGFLRSILVGFGFHPTMVEWIMRRVQIVEDFQYHHLCEQQCIVNLCFADDIFLFARGHPNFVRVIIDALEEFKNLSGLVPSIPKSTAFFCNVPNVVKASILSSMPFAEDTLLFKYLGVPLISSKLLYRDCKVLVEKLEIRVNDLKNKFLSLAGRLQLMKKGKAKVAWEAVCLPHREGGLGIRRLDDFNVALMTTHGWRKLLQIRTRIRPFIWHKINNGRSTSMWFDRWADSCPLRDMLTVRNIIRSCFSLSNTVSDLISNGSWRWPHDWSARFPNVVNIPVPDINNELDDVIVWRDVQEDFHCFSVAGAWDSLRLRADVVDWYHVVWFPHCVPRHALHMWLVIKEKLKTQDRLWQWDVSPSIDLNLLKCPLCEMVPDSHSHLLFKKKKSTANQIVQMITSLVRMKLVAFKFKKMTTGSRLLLDQWKIPSSFFDHDRSSSFQDTNLIHLKLHLEMKAKNENLCRTNVFIKTRTANNDTIPDEDTRIVVDRMKEKLNEVPQSEQTDLFKEQVFIDLVGSDGHGSVKNFGEGVSSLKVLGLAHH